MSLGQVATPDYAVQSLWGPNLAWTNDSGLLPIEGSIGLVQNQKALADSAGTAAISADFNVTAGNLLIVAVTRYTNNTNDPVVVGDLAKTGGTSTIGTIALDSKANDASNPNDFIDSAIFSIPCTGSGSLTFTYTGNASEFYFLSFQEWTGLQTTLSAQASANGSSVAPASGTISPSGEGLVIGCMASNSVVAVTVTEGSQYALIAEEENGAAHAVASCMYKITDVGGTHNATWDLSATKEWAACIAFYPRFASIVLADVAETAAATDSETVSAVFASAIAESNAIADSTSATIVTSQSVAETNPVTSTESAGLLIVSSTAETAAATESESVTLTAVGAVAETAAATDTESASFVAVASQSETAAVTDTVSALASFVASVSESVSATSTESGGIVVVASASETTSLTESVSAALVAVAAVAESAAVSDTVSAVLLAVVAQAESAGIDDSVSCVAVYVSQQSESVAVADTEDGAVVGGGGLNVSVNESASITDIEIVHAVLNASAFDVAVIIDLVSVLDGSLPTVPETFEDQLLAALYRAGNLGHLEIRIRKDSNIDAALRKRFGRL